MSLNFLAVTAAAAALHVSPDGQANAPGTPEKPLGSITAALQLAAEQGTREVVIHRGTYVVRQPLKIDSRLNGLTLSAAAGERAVISGFAYLPPELWRPEKCPRVLDRAARQALLACDLAKAGISTVGEPSRRGFDADDRFDPRPLAPGRLYFGSDPLVLARYPNSGFVHIESVVDPGPTRADGPAFWENGGRFVLADDRPARWSTAADVWIDGILSENWAWSYNRVRSYVPATRTVALAHGEVYGIKREEWIHDGFFFEDLPEELDRPGEYWIDRAQGRAWLWPPEGFAKSRGARLSTAENPLLVIDNAANIVLRGLYFEGSRTDGVQIRAGESCVMEDCEVRACSGHGVVADGHALKIVRLRCHDVGGSGLRLTGGDPASLASSGSVVEDSHFFNVADYDRAYRPAIWAGGVGHIVRRCEFGALPHMAVVLDGNDFTIEGCDFHDSCQRFGDVASIYLANPEHPERRGHVIRNNRFHDVGDGTGASRGAIYADNGASGLTVTGNVFERVGKRADLDFAVMIHGGGHVRVEGNTFIDCPMPLRVVWWLDKSGRDQRLAREEAWKKALASPAGVAAAARYPELAKFIEEDRVFPSGNTFKDNVFHAPTVPLGDPSGCSIGEGPAGRVEVGNNLAAGPAHAIDLAGFGPRR